MNAHALAEHLNSWATVRYELLNTPIRELRLSVEGSGLDSLVGRLHRELIARGLSFLPDVYLADSWGCPDRVPIIGIPFYLADQRLTRIEEEQTGEVEDSRTVLQFLRHEAGHAYNYAYRLWDRPDWVEAFGSFDLPYRETFQAQPQSKNFVHHLYLNRHGTTYAQKHPDEDFAETFAVWLTPRIGWARKYRNWPVIRKLRYVSLLMRDLHGRPPEFSGGKRSSPVEAMPMTLAEHYQQRVEIYREAAQGYVDDRLRWIFPRCAQRRAGTVSALMKRDAEAIRENLVRWSGLSAGAADAILEKLLKRTTELRLRYDPERIDRARLDLASLATALAMDYAYTGRLI